jgi:hypothetical protein
MPCLDFETWHRRVPSRPWETPENAVVPLPLLKAGAKPAFTGLPGPAKASSPSFTGSLQGLFAFSSIMEVAKAVPDPSPYKTPPVPMDEDGAGWIQGI